MRRIALTATLIALLFARMVWSGEPQGAKKEPLELTQLALQFPRHKGSTTLYVNFDGWSKHDKEGHNIEPFKSTTGNRDRDIQDILFRTAERYAPFDVEVRRMKGNGKYDHGKNGNTTVFVGGDTAHIDKEGRKYQYGVTPGQYLDYPSSGRGDTRRPNSDPFDLAFADPMTQDPRGKGWINAEDNNGISMTITHEGGHTFGLAHTHSKPVPDVMSYDAPNSYFANKVLPITNDNNTGTTLSHDDGMIPKWKGEPVLRQNSFTYLRAVLGARKRGEHAKVAERATVDPGFKDGKLETVEMGDSVSSKLSRYGDYDVYRLRVEDHESLVLTVTPEEESALIPVILVYDDKGERLFTYGHGRKARDHEARLVVRLESGRTYKLVVGTVDGNSKGAYELTVEEK
jgi:hypothetical protein